MAFLDKLIRLFEKYKWVIVAFVVIILILIYSFVNPYTSKELPKCSFYALTGYKCPGCGSQRAIYNLLHFRFLSALKENAILILAIPYIILGVFFDLKKTKSDKLHRVQNFFFGLKAIWRNNFV